MRFRYSTYFCFLNPIYWENCGKLRINGESSQRLLQEDCITNTPSTTVCPVHSNLDSECVNSLCCCLYLTRFAPWGFLTFFHSRSRGLQHNSKQPQLSKSYSIKGPKDKFRVPRHASWRTNHIEYIWITNALPSIVRYPMVEQAPTSRRHQTKRPMK